MTETTGSTSIEIACSPQQAYDTVTDLSRIGDLSPECYKAEWLDDATTPAVGARFRGYNQVGEQKWDVECTVTAAAPGAAWAFEISAGDTGMTTTWRYDIEATDSGCKVTESFDAPILTEERFQQMGRHDMLVGNISQTLENLKTICEA